MSDLDPDDRLYDLPLVDSLRFDSAGNFYAIVFVPSDDASPEPKESVRIGRDDRDFNRVDILFRQINRITGRDSTISYIVHSGGGNFAFQFENGRHIELADLSNEPGVAAEIADRLKQIADAAQLAFLATAHH